MSTNTLVIKARIEEVPTLAQFTIDSFTRDLPDFQAYKPTKYNAGFLTALGLKLDAVKAIINPLQLTGELKLITADLFTNTHAIRPLIDKLEGYLADATGLSLAPKDFGISAVRKNVTKDDQEALSSALTFLLANITNNMGQLTAADYTVAQKNALADIKVALDKDNANQNKKIRDRALLVENNYGTINELCQIIKDIWADGKRLYKTSRKSKLPDYTNTKLIDRIRQEQLRTVVSGNVTDAGGLKLKDVKLKGKPIDGGRSKTIKPNKDSFYEFKGLKPVLLNITVTAKDKDPYLIQVTPVTNETVIVNIFVP